MVKNALLVSSLSLLSLTALPHAQAQRDVGELYAQLCAACHGPKGEGGSAPSMLDEEWAHGDDDASIARIIREGYLPGGMPPFGGALSDSEVRGLVVYLRELTTDYRRTRDTLPPPSPDKVFQTEEASFRIETVAEGVSTPWSIGWLPDGRMLFTEKNGTLRLWSETNGLDPKPIAGIPRVFAQGQGGLYDVVAHPDYDAPGNGWIYLAFSDPLEKDGRTASLTKIIRGRLRDHALVDQETIWQGDPEDYVAGGVHWGGRLAFDGQGYLFFSHGERGRGQDAQDLTVPNGKIHRIHDNGRVPADNPFVDVPGAEPTIWTYGNRNPQGLAFDPATGLLWETEHGPRGGDELNIIERGANYGWPEVTYGMNYNGRPITETTTRPDVRDVVIHWTPSIAVCGTRFYTGDAFPAWKGNLLVGALAQMHVRRLVIEDGKVTKQEVIFSDIGRVRDVSSGPDGYIYVALNSPDEIIRLVPAQR